MERNSNIDNFFILQEKESRYYTIAPNFEILNINISKGNFNILPARLLNISYATYLRLCRDKVGALLIGKNMECPIPLFKKSDKRTYLFLRLLNKKMKYIKMGEMPQHIKDKLKERNNV